MEILEIFQFLKLTSTKSTHFTLSKTILAQMEAISVLQDKLKIKNIYRIFLVFVIFLSKFIYGTSFRT